MGDYIGLRDAIVIQASMDYQTAYKHVILKYDLENSEKTMKECEEFIKSEWFKFLTNWVVDGEMVIRELKQNVESKQLKKVPKRWSTCSIL